MMKSKLKGMFMNVVESPIVYLMAQRESLDFVLIDREHGFIPMQKLHDLTLFGNNIGLATFVRVPELTKENVSKTLDAGVTGLMVPMIETVEQAKKLVDYSKYSPIGKRGYSSGANTNYVSGKSRKEATERINNRTLTIAQIETKRGVDNIDEIARLEGIDALIVGPADLSISLGLIDDELNDIEIKAIEKVQKAARRNHKLFGIIGPDALLDMFKGKLDIFVVTSDIGAMRQGINEAMKRHRSKYEEV